MQSRYAIKVPLSTINDAVQLLRKGRIEQKSDERIIVYGRKTGRPPIEKKTIKEGKLAVRRMIAVSGEICCIVLSEINKHLIIIHNYMSVHV